MQEPFLPQSLLRARRRLGLAVDPGWLIARWSTRVTRETGAVRYPWAVDPRFIVAWPDYTGDSATWRPWRAREASGLEEDIGTWANRFLTPLVLAETVEFLTDPPDADAATAAAARALLEAARPALRRDVVAYALERNAWSDTWALWSIARRPAALTLLHPFALAIADAYAERARRDDQVVLGSRYPFHGVPLVSATAQLAGGLVALGYHPRLVGAMAHWIRLLQARDGGWGDADDPPDLLTTFVAADLLAGLDPTYDPDPTVRFFRERLSQDGWWRAFGPETPWLTDELDAWLTRAARPFAERFRWPHLAVAQRDRRTGLPLFAYYGDLAALCAQVPGLASARQEVAFLDLVGFGNVNNTLGMEAGDTVLEAFAGALAGIEGTLVVRDGGDEFLVVGAPTAEGLSGRLKRFREETWPERYRRLEADPRVGAEPPPVAPRVLVAATMGRELVWLRNELGRRVGELKHTVREVGPTGVQVDLGELRPPGR